MIFTMERGLRMEKIFLIRSRVMVFVQTFGPDQDRTKVEWTENKVFFSTKRRTNIQWKRKLEK